MLYIILKPNPLTPAAPQCAHLFIGDHDQATLIANDHDRIVKVIADEDELDFINQTFDIPKSNRKDECTWFGDHAKFIVANW